MKREKKNIKIKILPPSSHLVPLGMSREIHEREIFKEIFMNRKI
jgi:hypothetical protein